MKTTFLHASTKTKPSLFVLVGIILVGGAMLFFSNVRSFFSSAVYSVAPFVWKTGNNVGQTFQSFFVGFRSKQLLLYENESLKRQVDLMKVQVLNRDLLAQKIIELEATRGEVVGKRVRGEVLSGPGLMPYDTLSIDVGTNLGIKVGDVVAYTGAGVIGEIAEVYSSSSKVKLFSSPGKETNSLIGSHKIPAKSRGRGMGNFEATVPSGSPIAVDDMVLLPGGKLILGKVGEVEEKPGEPFVRVLIRTTFNISEISEVEVLIK
ncbi:MAG: rod shape-determining protein MreC [Candidatus Pacebacteria bacterium]|nr:rod shape-determining protein MreC [Candidatus Paceibacterota bacterium]